MANYGDFRGVLEQIAKHLRRIESNTLCSKCNGIVVKETTSFVAATPGTTGLVTIDGVAVGVGITGSYPTLADYVTALNTYYSAIATFYLNASNDITVVSKVEGDIKLLINGA